LGDVNDRPLARATQSWKSLISDKKGGRLLGLCRSSLMSGVFLVTSAPTPVIAARQDPAGKRTNLTD